MCSGSHLCAHVAQSGAVAIVVAEADVYPADEPFEPVAAVSVGPAVGRQPGYRPAFAAVGPDLELQQRMPIRSTTWALEQRL